jgi:Phage integrase central domain
VPRALWCANNIDPIEHRISERAKARAAATGTLTFEAYAKQYIAGKEVGWKNEKHRQQWSNSLRDYAYPIIGQIAISDVDTESVLKALRPVWNVKKETARRVRGRIEAILNAAKAEGLRTGENPALWRGHLDQVLARRRKSDVQHHPALPYEEMPQFWRSLTSDTSDGARMLRWIILTACRFNEAAEMDMTTEVKSDVWTVPAIRMKAEREHKVPLTNLALAQLPFRPVSDVTLSTVSRATRTQPPRLTACGRPSAIGAVTVQAFRARSPKCVLRTRLRMKPRLPIGDQQPWLSDVILMEAWAAYCSSVIKS